MLDAQEYLHLAIKYIEDGDHQRAMEQLHSCLDQDPNSAMAIYLLAVEHAELGMFDRAMEGMEKALSIDPDLEIAALQLGLLYGRKGDDEQAIGIWEKLQRRSDVEYIKLMVSGLVCLCKNELEKASSLLEQGILANAENEALNESMRNVLNSIMSHSTSEETSVSTEPSPYLGAYKNNVVKGAD